MMVEAPSIVAVESLFQKSTYIFIFSKHKYRFDAVQRFSGRFPEINGNHTGHTTSETVNIVFSYPATHCCLHTTTQTPLRTTKQHHLCPPEGCIHIPQRILCIPIGMLEYPRIVPGAVVGNPVDYLL